MAEHTHHLLAMPFFVSRHQGKYICNRVPPEDRVADGYLPCMGGNSSANRAAVSNMLNIVSGMAIQKKR